MLYIVIMPVVLILVLPLLGVFVAGQDIVPHLNFPPKPGIIPHPPFSMYVFIAITLFIFISVMPFLKKATAYKAKQTPNLRPMPWWGITAFLSIGCFWLLAWTRLPWMTALQPHTFFPVWLGWIICVNAISFRRSGHCPIVDAPVRFGCLFLVSSLFWWVFEYLNRFVGNWIYSGSQYSALTYFGLATLSFSTVLPAVESMKAYLLTFDLFQNGFKQMPALKKIIRRPLATAIMILSCIFLFLIGIFPNQLFPLVWISPFILLLSFRVLAGWDHSLSGAENGDYTFVAAYAASALVCGLFWEMFNFYSLARWEYAIPYVNVLKVFEMPILGYAGYLPFGLECALVIDLVIKPGQNN